MKHLPNITQARINRGRRIVGSFIDAEWVLHYIESGCWEFQIGPHLYAVQPGDMVLTTPRCLHVVRVTAGKRLVQHVVHFELNDPPVRRAEIAPVLTLPGQVRTDILHLNDRLRREWERGAAASEVVASGYLVAMLGIYFRHLPAAKPAVASTNCHWPNIENAVRFIQTHYRDKSVNLARIGEAAALSPNYLCAVFKAGTGISIKRYLQMHRLEKVEELLLNSRLNCSQIADEVGLAGVHVLSRIFKKHKQLSPTQYRARHGSP